MKTKIILDIPKGKSIKDCHLSKIEVLDKEVFKTKGEKCEICGSTKHLNIHHPFYTKGKLAWEYNPSDMMVLCHDCHKEIHNIK